MAHLSGSLYRRGKIWWLAYYQSGVQIRESSHSTDRHQAEILLTKRKSESATEDSRSAEEILQKLRTHFLLLEKSPWGPLVIQKHLMPYFASFKACEITGDELLRYVSKRKKDGRANATINKEIAILRRAFVFSEIKAPKFSKLPESTPREGFFSQEEFSTLYNHLPKHIQPIALIGYWTGCRLGEILNLRWRQVDLEARTIRLRPNETKSGWGRVIPMPQSVVDSLKTLGRESEWIFIYRGQPIRSIKTGWATACKQCGVRRLFHDLRRTAVRNLVRAGVPERVAMEISGHRTRSIFDRYNIVGEGELLRAIDKTFFHMQKESASEEAPSS